MNNVFKKLGQFKVYFTQAGNYIGMANFAMLLMNIKQLYSINISIFILIPLGFLAMIFIGVIDYKLILPQYLKHVNNKNDLKRDTELIIEILKQKKGIHSDHK